MAIDLSAINYFLPLLSFLVVFVITFAVINKTKIIESMLWQMFIAFIVATIFVSGVTVRTYVLDIIPWFAALLVCLFLILVLIGFGGKDLVSWNAGAVKGFAVVLIIGFLISAIVVFSPLLIPQGLTAINIRDWFFSSQVIGAVLLLVISFIVSWILIKTKA